MQSTRIRTVALMGAALLLAAAAVGLVSLAGSLGTNDGAIRHELVVIRTDKWAGGLLKGKEASEAGAVDEIGDLPSGATKRLALNLKPGHYALICNLPGHYKGGMFADFTVR